MMIDFSSYALFVAATLVFLVTPGPAVIYIVSRSLYQGRSAGVASTLGLSVGLLFHVGAAVAGLSAILATSAVAYSAVRWIGGAYLVYLGLRTLFGDRSSAQRAELRRKTLRRVFVDGIVVNVFNPKPALFLMAFLPQFTHPEAGSIPQQIAFLGLTIVVIAMVTDLAYAIAAGSLRFWFVERGSSFRAGRYLVGSTYVGLGLAAIFTGRRNG